jgi:hypothetical protein
VAIAFKWGNGSNGRAGGSGDVTSYTVGVDNAESSNGALVAGDLLIAIVCVTPEGAGDSGAISVVGFTTIQDSYYAAPFNQDLRLWVGYKVAQAGEVASYPASWANAADAGWVLLNFGGTDINNPIDVSDKFDDGVDGDTHIAPSITPNFSDDVWLAIEARYGGNAPDTPSAPLVAAYDTRSNSIGRPEISTAYLQLESAAPTGTGTFTQAAFGQASVGVSIGLVTAHEAVVTQGQPGGAGSVVGRKRKRKEEIGTPAFARRPLSEMYKPVQFFDFEEDDETVVLLTI